MRTTFELKRVDVWSLFKISFFLYAALGLAIGIVYALIIAVAGGLGTILAEEDFGPLGWLTGIVGFLAVPFLALFYGVLGSATVAVGGLLFNLAAKAVGGLKLNAEVEAVGAAPFDVADGDDIPTIT